MATKKRKLELIHPGEVLSEHFIAGYPGMTAYRVATGIGARPSVVYELVNGKRSITAPIALRLARYFGNSAQFWMNLQTHYELELAESEHGKRVELEVKPLAA